jgi:hypothetical protein
MPSATRRRQLVVAFPHPATGCRLVFEDSGEVATAWLEDPEGAVLADVWLYNHRQGPEALALGRPPFLNPRALSRPLDQPFPRTAREVTVAWAVEGELLLAEVRLRGRPLGRLAPGSHPGWSACAVADGPLARRLEADVEARRGDSAPRGRAVR